MKIDRRHARPIGLALILTLASCSTDTPTCPPGTEGCPCHNDTCDPGLVCGANVCVPELGFELAVDDATVRACELVIYDPEQAIQEAVFASSVLGEQIRRGPHLAISFAQQQDTAVARGAVTLQFVAGTSRAKASLAKARCFDRLGQPRPSAVVTIGN